MKETKKISWPFLLLLFPKNWDTHNGKGALLQEHKDNFNTMDLLMITVAFDRFKKKNLEQTRSLLNYIIVQRGYIHFSSKRSRASVLIKRSVELNSSLGSWSRAPLPLCVSIFGNKSKRNGQLFFCLLLTKAYIPREYKNHQVLIYTVLTLLITAY